MLPAHIWPVYIVGAKDDGAFEVFSPEVNGHNLADNFARGVGIARVVWVRDGKWHVLVSRDSWRSLVDFRAGGQDKFAHLMFDAGIEHIDHALDAYVKHELRLAVEELRAIDERQMTDALHTPYGLADDVAVAREYLEALNNPLAKISKDEKPAKKGGKAEPAKAEKGKKSKPAPEPAKKKSKKK